MRSQSTSMIPPTAVTSESDPNSVSCMDFLVLNQVMNNMIWDCSSTHHNVIAIPKLECSQSLTTQIPRPCGPRGCPGSAPMVSLTSLIRKHRRGRPRPCRGSPEPGTRYAIGAALEGILVVDLDSIICLSPT